MITVRLETNLQEEVIPLLQPNVIIRLCATCCYHIPIIAAHFLLVFILPHDKAISGSWLPRGFLSASCAPLIMAKVSMEPRTRTQHTKQLYNSLALGFNREHQTLQMLEIYH